MSIATSLLYAAPVVPALIYGWYLQTSGDRTVRKLTGVKACVGSNKALEAFLLHAGLNEVAVVKSDNYMQNEYVAEDGKIHLSPDTMDKTDAASVALALRAGAQAVAARDIPQQTASLKSLGSVESVIFWAMFAVLAFGIMSSAAALTIGGYALGVVVWAIWARRTSILRKIDSFALDFIANSPAFDAETRKNVEAVLAAERKKF